MRENAKESIRRTFAQKLNYPFDDLHNPKKCQLNRRPLTRAFEKQLTMTFLGEMRVNTVFDIAGMDAYVALTGENPSNESMSCSSLVHSLALYFDKNLIPQRTVKS